MITTNITIPTKNDTYQNDNYIMIPTNKMIPTITIPTLWYLPKWYLPKYIAFEKSLSQIWIQRKLKNPTVGRGTVDPKDVIRLKV